MRFALPFGMGAVSSAASDWPCAARKVCGGKKVMAQSPRPSPPISSGSPQAFTVIRLSGAEALVKKALK